MSELETPWLLAPGSWFLPPGSSLWAPGPREEMEMKYSLTENLEQTMLPQWEKSLHVQKSRRWGLQEVG